MFLAFELMTSCMESQYPCKLDLPRPSPSPQGFWAIRIIVSEDLTIAYFQFILSLVTALSS